MKIILFSREQTVIDHWIEKLGSFTSSPSSSQFSDICSCLSFKELGEAITDEDHILLFHLAHGEIEEKICYQFITKYQQQQRMIVFVNTPDPTQGLRIFRSGVHGYSNTYLDEKKLLVAIDVIAQGKIWIGAEILNHLLNNYGVDAQINGFEMSGSESSSYESKLATNLNQQQETSSAPSQSLENKNSLVGALFKGIKKLFG